MNTERTKLFFSLFMANQKRIYTYILMLISNAVDADDIMQDTATVMWQKFADFKAGTNFGMWGVRIAHNKILDYRKKKQHSRVHFSETRFRLFAEHAEASIKRVDERLEALRHCLDKLKSSDRRLIELHYERGVTVRSVAERAGRSVQGLYKVMARIHNGLLKCINRRLAAERMV